MSARSLSLESVDADTSVRVCVQCFVMWGEAEKQYICPEPWLGVPNSLNTGKGSVHLGAGETFEWTFSITPITF